MPQKKKRAFFGRRKRHTKYTVAEKRSRLSLLLYYTLIVLFLAVAAHILFFSSSALITHITIDGIQTLSYEAVLKEVQASLHGTYFGVVPKNNALLVYPPHIEKRLSTRFVRIARVDVERRFPHGLHVAITERTSLLVWCPQQAGAACYILDEQGIAYTEADFDAPEIKENNLITLRDEETADASVGMKVFSEETMHAFADLYTTISKTNLAALTGEMVITQHVSGDVSIPTEEGWRIFASTHLPVQQSARMFMTFLTQTPLEKDRTELDYVDLRFEDKVFYRFKGESEEQEDERVEERESEEDNEKESTNE